MENNENLPSWLKGYTNVKGLHEVPIEDLLSCKVACLTTLKTWDKKDEEVIIYRDSEEGIYTTDFSSLYKIRDAFQKSIIRTFHKAEFTFSTETCKIELLHKNRLIDLFLAECIKNKFKLTELLMFHELQSPFICAVRNMALDTICEYLLAFSNKGEWVGYHLIDQTSQFSIISPYGWGVRDFAIDHEIFYKK